MERTQALSKLRAAARRSGIGTKVEWTRRPDYHYGIYSCGVLHYLPPDDMSVRGRQHGQEGGHTDSCTEYDLNGHLPHPILPSQCQGGRSGSGARYNLHDIK